MRKNPRYYNPSNYAEDRFGKWLDEQPIGTQWNGQFVYDMMKKGGRAYELKHIAAVKPLMAMFNDVKALKEKKYGPTIYEKIEVETMIDKEEYYDGKILEIMKALEEYSDEVYDGTEIEYDKDGIISMSYYDEWTEDGVPCIQTDVDDFIKGCVDCKAEVNSDYDLYDYAFLRPEGQLIKDIISEIESEREHAIDRGIDKWIDNRREDRW